MLSWPLKGRKEKSAVSAANAANISQKEQLPPPQTGRTLRKVVKDKDEGLFLFLEMRRREKDRKTALVANIRAASQVPNYSLPPPGSKAGSPPSFQSGLDDMLNSEGNRSDYDWLLTPPGTPLLPLLDKEIRRSAVVKGPKRQLAALKSRPANPPAPPAKDSSVVVARQKTVSRGATGIQGTPSSVPAATGILETPSTVPAAPKSLRPSTPTSRAPLSVKPTARSCTPSSRPSLIAPPARTPPQPTTAAPRRPSTPSGLAMSIPERPSSASGSRFRAQSRSGPVAMGSKMVERAMNPRRLAPPNTQDRTRSHLAGASTGFGRTLSKTSLDMAIRHMDIRRSVAGSLRPTVTRDRNGVQSPLANRSDASSFGSERAMLYPRPDDDHPPPILRNRGGLQRVTACR